MKIIIKDFNNKVYNLNLTTEQVDFAKWLENHDALYSIKILDEIEWEDVN